MADHLMPTNWKSGWHLLEAKVAAGSQIAAGFRSNERYINHMNTIHKGFESIESTVTAGALGGLAASFVRVPTEVVKQRIKTGKFDSAPEALRLIVSREGFKGLFVGYGSFIDQFCIYEQFRIGNNLAAKRDMQDPENAIVGDFAGALTGSITNPLDVINTRLMIQGSTNQYKGIVDCVQTIVKDKAYPLFSRIRPRVLWIGIGGSIFFGVLESTKRFLAERDPNNQQNSKSKTKL
ncbi:S-adenosylmethionine carrier 1, chloroplastic/mitochondrial-like [Henckelia pumila]|uniref:S-adenosylmethionine carrier 1, chloroplastic/mitochondrial-like n=1 Tax=Henckelia pumila TaxID=405737 RepID=UPI003C6E0E8C